MSLALIWAEARGGIIGHAGTIPWHLPEDLAHFRELTSDASAGGTAGARAIATAPARAVVMGRRTWDSLPERFRPLPDRRNLVLTRNSDWAAAGAEAVPSLGAAAAAVKADNPADPVLWVIGGGELYRQAMLSPLATRLEVTELDLGVKGDTTAPRIDATWSRLAESPWLESKTGIRYRFVTHAR